MAVPFRALLLVIFWAPIAASAADARPEPSDLEQSLRRVADVYRLLEKHSYKSFDPEAAFYGGALPGMVGSLDPFSAFLDPDQFESLQEMQRSTEKGFGSVLSVNHGRVVVLQTLPDSPSARSGMAPGDEIVVVNGYALANLSIDQLIALLSQTRQHEAELLVKRPNSTRLLPLKLTPAEMADPSVQGQFFIEPGVAYMKVANFESGTDAELRDSIEQLGGADLEGLVLDFHGNPGGVVEAAVRTAAMFLEPRDRILWIQGREGPREEVRVPQGVEPYRFPLAVLIDDRTASAAELVVGALQDHDRARVIGSRSFGKGLVQSVFPLAESSGLALTTARYLSPSGRPIQRELDECHEYQLASCDEGPAETYKTDEGREIPGGGGIAPDQTVYPRAYSSFEGFLMGVDAFLKFAQEYVNQHHDIDEDFEVSSALLDEFQLYLSERKVRPTLAEWTSSVEFIRARLQQEILSLGVSVESGDRVERRHDPQVLAALRSLGN